MKECMVCGNEYQNCFEIIKDNSHYVFDCLECAIHKLAPTCASCSCRIIGHGIESNEGFYCCAHCARKTGKQGAKDNISF